MRSELRRLLPDAPATLCHILDGARGPLQAPIRSEIFGAQRFAEHGRSLGATHRAERASAFAPSFFPRLRSNIRTLREAHRYIGLQASTGYDISPAAEWLLDNFHLIEAQLQAVHEGLPSSYFRALPVLLDEPLAGLPRVYGVAWAFVAHTDGAFDEGLLIQYLCAYQTTRELNLGEMWALPTTLRVVLIENLRRLAERVATHKAAREVANLCCDHIENHTVAGLAELLGLLDQRGAGRVFLAQMAQRVQDLGATARPGFPESHRAWLEQALPDRAAVQVQQGADQAADNLSVSNAVTSLRAIGDADWPDIVARTSVLMRLMLSADDFAAEHVGTRDRTLHGIEQLARRSQHSEVDVAQTLLGLMASDAAADPACAMPSHWLRGAGRPALLAALGLHESAAQVWRGLRRTLALPVYLGVLLLGTAGLVAWLLPWPGEAATALAVWLTAAVALLMLWPASEAMVAVLNRLISESAQPSHLPRLALAGGIPGAHRVMVVIPGMLGSAEAARALAHRLELHYLANPEPQAQFALLTDWPDADSQQAAGDEALLACAVREITALNTRHPAARHPEAAADETPSPRFVLLHRQRLWSPTEHRWIGWERKRGKLEQLVAELAVGRTGAFIDLGPLSHTAAGIRHLLTLDADTQLPPGRLRELVGVAAHPHNEPRLDAAGRRVVSGYGVLQPRLVTPLPALHELTPFHWLFAGRCGIDPYSAASSEVYQDLFGEGSFTGKGMLDVRAVHAVLGGSLPEGQVLSHDLLEGSIVRCASVTDIALVEDAPFHADVAASRVHRWTRGDWQLLPFLAGAQRARHILGAVNRWKMFDNLRRSLVAPASLALVVLALGGVGLSPWAALALVMAAFTAGPLMGAVAGFSPSRDDIALRYFYRRAATELARALLGGLWHGVQLLQHAVLAVDAVVRALYRSAISRRHLLQWTTAESAQAQARAGLRALWYQHRAEPLLALALLGGLLASGTPYPALSLLLCTLWGAAPLWTWWVSRARPALQEVELAAADRDRLAGIARDTWRYFERCVVAGDLHLPPDNLQVLPHDMVAHRTSPTNIGLYLLSAACAQRFGWIGTQELLARLEATLATLAQLKRHRGHFMNWYDTQSGAALLPMYVSTVDSGNLCGHLLAVAQACIQLADGPAGARADGLVDAPFDMTPAAHALQASRARIEAQRSAGPAAWEPGTAVARLLALSDPLAAYLQDPATCDGLLSAARAEVEALAPEALAPDAAGFTGPPPPAPPPQRTELAWLLADHLATLRSAWQDLAGGPAARIDGSSRLRALAGAFEALAWQADFHFLYHPKRHLFHIGYRVAEQQLDAGFYDLLASESRLTSLLAVAKGDVPVSHWGSLGRLFYAVDARPALRSWSGSMFEYLMPTLVLDEPQGSVLAEACAAALQEQVVFAVAMNVPWGISESAHAGRDHTLAYQYAPQGVPRLALRRTPPDELVVAPYATALAAQIAPHLALANFSALEALSARGRYGFIEALDFTAARQAGKDRFTPVGTFMAHHQGMSIVALANVLLDGVAQRWGMGNAHVEAVASLLHERAPAEISTLYAPPPGPPPMAFTRRAPGLLRDLTPGATALEPTHLLSNGRYSVALRANGAGTSRRGAVGITRWRDDALRDACGHFFYLRRSAAAPLVTITQHPAPDPGAQYQAVFHADRVCFDAAWPDVQAHMTVWVSPEDDIEFRQVELRNLSGRVLDIELISAFEPTLAPPAADEAHPAFSQLFVQAEWQPAQRALVFERRPRLATEQGLLAAHFLADSDEQVVALRVQTDRLRWLGRNRDAGQPRAALETPPDAGPTPSRLGTGIETGLDPMCALGVQLRIAPHGKALLTFATAASPQAGVLAAVIDKYCQPSHVQRSSLMSATLAGIRLRALRIGAEPFAAVQALTTALMLSLARPQAQAHAGDGLAVCDKRLLWRFGISGDRPLILVVASDTHHLGLLRSLAQALRLWSWGGQDCDLVVVNAEPASYQMALQRELVALRERHDAESAAEAESPGPPRTRLHLLRAEEVSAAELATLQTLARVRLQADGRPLQHHVRDWLQWHEDAAVERDDISSVALPQPGPDSGPGGGKDSDKEAPAARGVFSAATGEFAFNVGAASRPARPWSNVLAQPHFGTLLTEAGGGHTWAVNSRMNQLTAWSNDAVSDPSAEWFLLHDRRTREVWNVAPSATADASATGPHHVRHGQGYSVITHRHRSLEVTVTWCVDTAAAVKQVQIVISNHGTHTRHLRAVGLLEWMMGASRVDRATVSTALFTQRLPVHDGPGPAPRLTALLCTQLDSAAGFGGGTAFLATVGDTPRPGLRNRARDDDREDWTCDRRECFDARGRLVLPDHFSRRVGSGLDPCAALSSRLTIGAGQSAERVFLVGWAASADEARQLATEAAAVPAALRLERVRAHWDELLGATTVVTPDPLFDIMVNRWLIYQAVACRLWAKAGFYQAGGATGFRDQLQDTLALAWAAPAMLREQIVLCASRQFAEGDVQHWWHAPGGAGVRTHFSDDLLWLPLACAHHLRTTGDATLLAQQVSFIEGAAIPAGAEDAYYTPTVSTTTASVYEHAARSIDHSLRVGVHGLPLMGSGDWNDGMNRVGHEGRGESVWLGWFLCQVVADFAPLARARGDEARALRWEQAAQGWKTALLGPAWDGQWFKRAFFDDGQALGTHTSAEARIDLIAQAWAVLSGVAPPALQRMAMAAVQEHLVDDEAGLVKLLDPPLSTSEPSAGYIQAYPPGVRENGGQYSHAGVWALMAQAELARRPQATEDEAREGTDAAWQLFTFLNPAHRASHPTRGMAYGIEPYVVAGDVYSQPPYVGKGGWSWYTGAAAWLHRAAIESIFGLHIEAHELWFMPCLPLHWPRAELTLRRDGRSMRFVLVRADAATARQGAAAWHAELLRPGQRLAWRDLAAHSGFVIPLVKDNPPPTPAVPSSTAGTCAPV